MLHHLVMDDHVSSTLEHLFALIAFEFVVSMHDVMIIKAFLSFKSRIAVGILEVTVKTFFLFHEFAMLLFTDVFHFSWQ